jgi:hypothetical protein
LATAFALARADEGAYTSLVGMAQSAQQDQGPDAGAIPPGAGKTGPKDAGGSERPSAAAGAAEAPEALKDAVADAPAPRGAAAKAAGAAGSPAFSFSPVPGPRLWTRLYATLMPSWRRIPALKSGFEPSVSTATARAPLSFLVPPPDSEAVKAGERRGLAELLSASAATPDAQ